jgi:hypothetical protein
MAIEPSKDAEAPTLARHYAAYLNALESIPLDGDFADYRWGKLPDPLNGIWLAYHQMFDEFATEIANSINQLLTYEHRLGAWESVLESLDEDARHEVLHEFVDPLATVSLNLPAVIRDRFIFAAAHLSHQANRALGSSDWEDDLPDDRHIKRVHAEQFGKRWPSNATFLTALTGLANQRDYDVATGNFRNKYHHRFPVRIGIGISGLINRQVHPKTKNVRYVIASIEPLQLGEIRRFLRTQIERASEVYRTFKALVREQEASITAWQLRQYVA